MKILFLYFIVASSLLEAQWIPKNDGLPVNWGFGYSIDAYDCNTALVSLFEDTFTRPLFLTTNGGNDWQEINWPVSELGDQVIDLSIVSENEYWICSYKRIFHTSDAGVTWHSQFFDSSKTEFFNYIEMFDDQNGIAMGDALNDQLPAIFLKTTNGGITWISVNDSAFGGISGDIWRKVDFISPEIGFYFAHPSQKLFKTTDGGNNWRELNSPAELTLIKFFSENIGIVQSYGLPKKVYRTVDGGMTWQQSTYLSQYINDFEFVSPEKIWAVDFDKILFSSDTGITWAEIPLSHLSGRDIVISSDACGWILGDDNLIVNSNSNQILSVPKIKTVETSFLSQNYPNPFNPSTKIEFTVRNAYFSSPVHVLLQVYNTLGELVATLLNEEKSAGTYEIIFDGEGLPGGVYYYQLKTENFFSSRKMILVK